MRPTLPIARYVSTALAVLVVVIALPTQWKQSWLPVFLSPDYHFGLDLAGGTQLDFRISESEIQQQLHVIDAEIQKAQEEGRGGDAVAQLRNEKTIITQQQANLVEAIRGVLERRINSLGVSEATITPSYVGGEKHLLVECPGIVDVTRCIETVGKTIQLEFKTEQTEADAAYEKTVIAKADAAFTRIKGGSSLAVVGQDLSTQLGVSYTATSTIFKDQLPKGLEAAWAMTPTSGVQRYEATVSTQIVSDNGETVDTPERGIFFIENLSPRAMTGRTIPDAPSAFATLAQREPALKAEVREKVILDDSLPPDLHTTLADMKPADLLTVSLDNDTTGIVFLRGKTPGQLEVDVSHLLVAYIGATDAGAVTRTKEEARLRALALKEQLLKGADFAALTTKESDGPSKINGGRLGPIRRGMLVNSFEDAAFSQAVGVISDPVETPFGYHLIKVEKAASLSPDVVSYDLLTVTGPDASTKAALLLSDLKEGKIQRTEEAIVLRTLFFSLKPTGWKDTPLDGKHFRAASVVLNGSTNLPEVQILFDDQGSKLFSEITKENIGKRIAIFVGGQLVTAPTVQAQISGGSAVITGSYSIAEAQELAQDLNTGAIPAPIYLSGQRTVEATLGAYSLQTSIIAALWGILIVMLYLVCTYRFLGVLASASLVIYAVIFLALLKLPLLLVSGQYIVLTLAGTAGMILSIGMAVDTNVLVFERVKEELKRGKMLKTAIDLGFDKAWPSIRDSNISTLITCALLFFIGTSIVRGFAVTLGLGVLISMLTGMIITRTLSTMIAQSSLAEKTFLFPGKRDDKA